MGISPHNPPTQDTTAALLPPEASDNARRIASLIGDPLKLPGVDPRVREVLTAAIKAGDAHGMMDFGLLAQAQAQNKPSGESSSS